MVGIREFGPCFTEWSSGTGRRVEPLRHRVFDGIGIQFSGDGRNELGRVSRQAERDAKAATQAYPLALIATAASSEDGIAIRMSGYATSRSGPWKPGYRIGSARPFLPKPIARKGIEIDGSTEGRAGYASLPS